MHIVPFDCCALCAVVRRLPTPRNIFSHHYPRLLHVCPILASLRSSARPEVGPLVIRDEIIQFFPRKCYSFPGVRLGEPHRQRLYGKIFPTEIYWFSRHLYLTDLLHKV